MSNALKKLAREGERIYRQKILRSRAARKKGYFAAIEVESGGYFIARKPLEAIEKAELVCPGKKYHLIRIGYPAASILKKGN